METSFASLMYEFNSFDFNNSKKIGIWIDDGKVHYSIEYFGDKAFDSFEDKVSDMTVSEFLKQIEKIGITEWEKHYEPSGDVVFLDGDNWTVKYEDDEGKIKITGENAYPANWKEFEKLLEEVC